MKELKESQIEIRLASSVRYLIAERSKRDSLKKEFKIANDYRPACLELPYSDEKLKVVFYGVNINQIKEGNSKEILIDLFLNGKKLESVSGLFAERKIKNVITSNGQIYSIEPIFIYLPPNPIMHRIPDFVILKISEVTNIET